MATPLTPDQILAAMRRAGLDPVEYPGWRTRGQSRAASKGFAPRAITIHHTAGNLGSRSVASYINDILVSDPDVPDKCSAAIAPDGSVWLVASGRANHHLHYSTQGLAAVTAGAMPTSGGSVNMRGSAQNFNAYAYGVEIIAAGAPNAAQREAAVKWAAALCWAHGWGAGEVVGHGELAYDRDHSDPGLDMSAFRADVAALVRRMRGVTAESLPEPSATTITEPPATPATIIDTEDTMRTIQTTSGACMLVTPLGAFHITDPVAASSVARVLTAGRYGSGDAVHDLELQLADAVIRQAEATLTAADGELLAKLDREVLGLRDQVAALANGAV